MYNVQMTEFNRPPDGEQMNIIQITKADLANRETLPRTEVTNAITTLFQNLGQRWAGFRQLPLYQQDQVTKGETPLSALNTTDSETNTWSLRYHPDNREASIQKETMRTIERVDFRFRRDERQVVSRIRPNIHVRQPEPPSEPPQEFPIEATDKYGHLITTTNLTKLNYDDREALDNAARLLNEFPDPGQSAYFF